MRTIERSTVFKRDYKRIKSMPRYKKTLDLLITDILECLLKDKGLPEKNVDHALSGSWNGYRECHIKPDLLLIYKKPNPLTLRLARLGSHSELFD
jgi:mRNA interferase YafQ